MGDQRRHSQATRPDLRDPADEDHNAADPDERQYPNTILFDALETTIRESSYGRPREQAFDPFVAPQVHADEAGEYCDGEGNHQAIPVYSREPRRREAQGDIEQRYINDRARQTAIDHESQRHCECEAGKNEEKAEYELIAHAQFRAKRKKQRVAGVLRERQLIVETEPFAAGDRHAELDEKRVVESATGRKIRGNGGAPGEQEPR